MSELLSLTVRMVSHGGHPRSEITVPRGRLKGGRSGRRGIHGRTIPVHADLASAIAIYLANYPFGVPSPESFLFRSRKGYNRPIGVRQAWHILKEAARAGGLDTERLSTHSLRKTFAAAVYEASGHDLRATQMLLGHTAIQTTVNYVEPNRGRLEAVVRGLPSRGIPSVVTPPVAARAELIWTGA